MEDKKNAIAKIENEFVLKAHYSLSATEQKLILYLASRINPQEDELFHKQIVPVKSLEKLFSSEDTKRWGSVYSYLENICDRLLTQTIRFTQPVILNNEERIIKGGINWFQHILIVENKQKEKSIEFMFSDMMKPFLLELNKYVKLNTLEIMDLRGKYSVRMYQVFKAERERTRKHKPASNLGYELEELKSFLGVSGKYKTLPNFRRRVLEPMIEEINNFSKEIELEFEYIKNRNKVTGIAFIIRDRAISPLEGVVLKDFAPTDLEVNGMANALYLAYMELIGYGVKEGIAFKQILPTIKAGDILGFEDVFVQHALKYFDKQTTQNTKEAKAGAFVKWWIDKKIFSDTADLYWILHEKTHKYKKSLSDDRKANRELAKNLPRPEFLKRVKG